MLYGAAVFFIIAALAVYYAFVGIASAWHRADSFFALSDSFPGEPDHGHVASIADPVRGRSI